MLRLRMDFTSSSPCSAQHDGVERWEESQAGESCGIPLLRKGRARMGHPRDKLAQESGRLGPCQRVPPVTSFSAELPKLLAQGQALHLIRRSNADAVNLFGRLQQSHVC